MSRGDEFGPQHEQWSGEASVWDQGHTRSTYGNRERGEGLTWAKDEGSWDAESHRAVSRAEGVRGSGGSQPLT